MKKILALVLIIIMMISCREQNNYSNLALIDHVLEGKNIMSIAFQSDGIAWVSTNETSTDSGGPSLIRYDITNDSIKIFNHTNSILDEQMAIADLEVDNQERIWFGSRGLYCYTNGSFTLYDTSNSVIPQNHIHAIAIDADNKIWATCFGPQEEAGVVIYDNGTFELLTEENSEIPHERVLDVEVGADHTIWMLANGNVIKYDGQAWTEYDEDDFGFRPYMIDDIAIDEDNNVCAVIDYAMSSASFNKNIPIIFIFNEEETVTFNAEMSWIPTTFVDSENEAWFSGYQYVRSYDGSNLKIYDLPHSSKVINESPSGHIWIGCNDGVYIYNK